MKSKLSLARVAGCYKLLQQAFLWEKICDICFDLSRCCTFEVKFFLVFMNLSNGSQLSTGGLNYVRFVCGKKIHVIVKKVLKAS
ncbi:hypothetical protein P8452_51490 [Trifolium repens]|nr:hypothetical protein P8452_51490 [Trifolium repens]